MDSLARDYLLLALGIGAQQEGIVDAYYGPPELRAEAEARRAAPGQLADDAAHLRARARDETDDQRAQWLDRQLVALETLARRVAGEEMAYLDEVERCFDARPDATPARTYTAVRQRLDELLPAGPSLHERLEARNERLELPPARLPAIVDWLLGRLRDVAGRYFGLPETESISVSFVRHQPWGAYNWYDGDLRSRIEINTDMPLRAHGLIGLLAHEAFPGHHLEHAWKEARLVREHGYGEATIQLINTPEAYISEGLAELGWRYVIDAEDWQQLLLAVCEQAGIPLTPDEARAEWQISESLRDLDGKGGDAALLLHLSHRPRAEVLRFLHEDALMGRQQAERQLEFISHPLWRTYVFCYAGGERLLEGWCAQAPDIEGQRGRFFRLLTEQLTPSGIAHQTA
jgi:hypothetical protein